MVSRRAWLRTLLQGVVDGLVIGRGSSTVEGGQVVESGQSSGPLTVRVTRPLMRKHRCVNLSLG